MPTWFVIRTVLLKLWVYVKNYWYIPAVVVALVAAYVFLMPSVGSRLIELLKHAIDRKTEEIDAVETAYQHEIEARDIAQKTYLDAMKKIAADKQREKDELARQKEEAAKALLAKHGNDPDALARDLADAAGLTVHTTRKP